MRPADFMRAHLARFCSIDETRPHLCRVLSVDVDGARLDVATTGHFIVLMPSDEAHPVEPMEGVMGASPENVADVVRIRLATTPVNRVRLLLWAGFPEWPIPWSCDECDGGDGHAIPHVRDGVMSGQPVDRNKVAQILSCSIDETVNVGVDIERQMVEISGDGWRALLMGIRQADEGSPTFDLPGGVA